MFKKITAKKTQHQIIRSESNKGYQITDKTAYYTEYFKRAMKLVILGTVTVYSVKTLVVFGMDRFINAKLYPVAYIYRKFYVDLELEERCLLEAIELFNLTKDKDELTIIEEIRTCYRLGKINECCKRLNNSNDFYNIAWYKYISLYENKQFCDLVIDEMDKKVELYDKGEYNYKYQMFFDLGKALINSNISLGDIPASEKVYYQAAEVYKNMMNSVCTTNDKSDIDAIKNEITKNKKSYRFYKEFLEYNILLASIFSLKNNNASLSLFTKLYRDVDELIPRLDDMQLYEMESKQGLILKYIADTIFLKGDRQNAIEWGWKSYELLSKNKGNMTYDENLGLVLYSIGLFYKDVNIQLAKSCFIKAVEFSNYACNYDNVRLITKQLLKIDSQ